jgi:radical SAM protein with 4Fe4S-binding SPASM domain
MNARRINGEAPGGKRIPLREVLPLQTPFVVQIFPIYACNFRCKYCHFSSDRDKFFVTDVISLDLGLFKKCIDDMTSFPQKIKTLRLVGMGEPLLHKDLAAMVAYAKRQDIADTVEILTNASLLTHDRSDELIDAGLDRIVVSIQGTGPEKYQEISGVNIDFEKFRDNLRYFYKRKKKTRIYFKVVDCALIDKDDEARFFELFGDSCDTIGIEHAVPIFPGAEYNDKLGAGNEMISQFGLTVPHIEICPQPFYLMQINSDGKVVGCHSIPYPQIIGDCNNGAVPEIWNGDTFRDFRLKMLNGRRSVCKTCLECNIMNLRIFPEDDISADAERLKKCY